MIPLFHDRDERRDPAPVARDGACVAEDERPALLRRAHGRRVRRAHLSARSQRVAVGPSPRLGAMQASLRGWTPRRRRGDETASSARNPAQTQSTASNEPVTSRTPPSTNGETARDRVAERRASAPTSAPTRSGRSSSSSGSVITSANMPPCEIPARSAQSVARGGKRDEPDAARHEDEAHRRRARAAARRGGRRATGRRTTPGSP